MSPIAVTTSAGVTITVYRPGGVVAAATTQTEVLGYFYTTIPVYQGHGFVVNDRVMIGIDPMMYTIVTGISGNDVTVLGVMETVVGDVLVNLGGDSGPSEPNFDGSDVAIYTTPDTSTPAIDESRVTTNDQGEYDYFHSGSANLWELIRDTTGAPIEVIRDAYQTAPAVQYAIRYAHLFATSGTGTETDPWVTVGSNPTQAALDDLPITGGVVEWVVGHFDHGDVPVNIPILTGTLDHRAYTFRGAGRDLTYIYYNGIDAAFRYAQVNTGTLGSSYQSNQLVFKGFAIRQNGTPRVGSAFYMTYVSESLWEDLNVGNSRQDRQSGEPDYGWAYGIRWDGTPGDNVCDFNRVDNCHFLGNGLAIYGQNQCDNTTITRCSFEPRQNSTDAQNGVLITNSSGLTILGNHFNFFDNDGTSYALRLATDISGVQISGNYFEGNWNAVWLYSDGNQDGIVISGNLFAINQPGLAGPTYRIGVRAGVDSAVWSIRGLVIQGNQFQQIKDYCRGVRIGGDVRSYLLLNNRYDITGTTDSYNNTRVTGAGFGSEGICIEGIPESNSTTNETSAINISHKAQDGTAINIRNTNAGSQKSPRLRFSPKTDLTLDFMLEASAAGALNLVAQDGSVISTVSQAGALATSSNITSGGHLAGLLQTQSFTSSDTIAHAGRTVVDITNTSGANTLVVAAPSSVNGKILILRVAAITTGSFVIADGGNCSLSAAWDSAVGATVGSTLTLIASGSVWYEIARSKNT